MSEQLSALGVVVKEGLVGASIDAAIKAYCEEWNVDQFLGLIQTSVVSELILRDVLADYFDLPVIDVVESAPCIGRNFDQHLSFRIAKNNTWFPFRLSAQSNTLILIVADPTKTKEFELLKKQLNLPLELWVAEYTVVQRAIRDYYPIEMQLDPANVS